MYLQDETISTFRVFHIMGVPVGRGELFPLSFQITDKVIIIFENDTTKVVDVNI